MTAIRMLLVCSLLAIGLVIPARESSSLLLLGTGLLGLRGAWRRKRILHRIGVRRLYILVRRRLHIF